MTYVDDIFISGQKEVVKEVAAKFQSTWKTSTPEEAGEVPVRFLGMEVTSRGVEGEDQMEWRMTQESYIQDLFARYEDHGKQRRLPITRDQAMMTPDTMEPSAESVKTSQKLIGELLWLVSRTRPDLMFGVSRMGGNVLKSSQCIKETAAQMRSYLKGTQSEGLSYKEKPEDPVTLYVYSGSSFAPDSDESHGCFVVMINGGLMFWRSGRQSTITLSTAESELMELVEAMVAGESVYVIISELFGEVNKMALCDSQAALAILVAEGGSWRTRHLRLHWAYARQSVLRGDWQLGHVPGERMVADLGTKALTSTRIEVLKSMLGMNKVDRPAEEEGEVNEKPEKKAIKTGVAEVAATAIKLITLAATLPVSNAQEEEEENYGELCQLMMIYTVFGGADHDCGPDFVEGRSTSMWQEPQ